MRRRGIGDTFQFWGRTHEYFNDPYNTTIYNERAVEIPIVRDWIGEYGIDVEIGNVLGHYGHTGHRVIDRYEEADGVENIDVFDLEDDLESVIAISTLEHVRWDEPDRDPNGSVRALEHLIERSRTLLVTVPMGHHPYFDQYLLGLDAHASTMVRFYDGWIETAVPVWAPYGATTKWAESVWIGAFYQ